MKTEVQTLQSELKKLLASYRSMLSSFDGRPMPYYVERAAKENIRYEQIIARLHELGEIRA